MTFKEFNKEINFPEGQVIGKKSENISQLNDPKVDVNQKGTVLLESLNDKKNEEVSQEAYNKLNQLVKMKEDDLVDKYLLETVLKERIQEKMASIFSTITPEKVKELYASVKTSEERAALELLFKEYEEKDQLEKGKKKEIQKVIRATKIELENFQGQLVEQASYRNEHFRAAPETHFTTGKTETKTLSDTELKNLDTLLSDKNLSEGRLNKLERSLKSDFRKALVLANLPVKSFLSLLDQQKDQKI